MLFIVIVGLIASLVDALPWASKVPLDKKWTLFPDPKTGEMVFVDLYPQEDHNPLSYIIDPDQVDFYLYNETNPTTPTRVYVNENDTLLKAGFNPKYKTKLLVHGFLNDVNSDTVQSIKNNFFSTKREKYNVIVVDWSAYTKVYINVNAKAQGIGSLIGSFINFLVDLGVSLEDIHCIGHSLGAHACGFAGKAVTTGKISRISGLDPALPGFKVTNPTGRLDATDARFVDCIHTCMGFLGLEEPVCSADYYPNSGKDQPGCHWYDFGVCSHGRSHEYFAESILDGHIFPALSCETMDFSPDYCIFKGAMMGYPAIDEYTGIFYTTTNDHYPYAKNWTQIATSTGGPHKN